MGSHAPRKVAEAGEGKRAQARQGSLPPLKERADSRAAQVEVQIREAPAGGVPGSC